MNLRKENMALHAAHEEQRADDQQRACAPSALPGHVLSGALCLPPAFSVHTAGCHKEVTWPLSAACDVHHNCNAPGSLPCQCRLFNSACACSAEKAERQMADLWRQFAAEKAALESQLDFAQRSGGGASEQPKVCKHNFIEACPAITCLPPSQSFTKNVIMLEADHVVNTRHQRLRPSNFPAITTRSSTATLVQAAEALLRDYASLAGSVLQLAAYTCGDADGVASSVPFSARSSAASDENCNSASNRESRDAAGLLSPGAAALALQRGAAGAHLLHTVVCFACRLCSAWVFAHVL
jgi:hypothetical protein